MNNAARNKKISKVKKKAYDICRNELDTAWTRHLHRLAKESSDKSLAIWVTDCQAAKAKYQAAIK